MSTLAFAALALVGLRLSELADNSFGQVCFMLVGIGLFVAGLSVAPWSEAFA